MQTQPGLAPVFAWPSRCGKPETSGRMRVLFHPGLDNPRTRNPYFKLLAKSLAAEGVDACGGIGRLWSGRYDLVQMNFPEQIGDSASLPLAVAKAFALLGGLYLARLRRKPVVWAVHNLRPHAPPRFAFLARLTWRLFERLCDGTISLSRVGRDLVNAAHPGLCGLPQVVIPHGHYRDVIGVPPSRETSRRLFGLEADADVFCHFGRLQEYKGCEQLVEAFAALKTKTARLLICGAFETGASPFRQRLEDALAVDCRIHAALTAGEDRDLIAAIAAADVVVLPYQDILNSGSVLFALSCGRPVCAPRAGALAELQHCVTPEWLFLYDPPLSPAILAEALPWARAARRRPEPPLQHFAWPAIARMHRAYYGRLIRLKRQGGVC
jgi:beta-1,4-mannosyltransferase